MSRFRSAVNKAVEVGNKNNLTRTVKNYADSVVQQAGHAVVEGAKILQDRIELGSLSWWSDAGGGRWWSEAGGGRYVHGGASQVVTGGGAKQVVAGGGASQTRRWFGALD
nr:coiled-coil domain-containing protein 18-like [Ipomoea batatas]